MIDRRLGLNAERRAGAVLTVDLDKVAENWRRIGACLAPPARASAVVKADAYGLGAIPVAKALRRAGCGRFFVATLDEAIALRLALDDIEILALNGLDLAFLEDYRRYRVVPVLNAADEVAAWRGMGLPSAIQIDTGMSRLGLPMADAKALAADPSLAGEIGLMLVMNHLACSDEPNHPMNPKQLADFCSVRALFPEIEGSLAASAGIFLGSDYHADWVRPGAALYGINPTRGHPNPMLQPLLLQARILQIREIDALSTVGYGATHSAPGPARLATVALGYADGIARVLGNRGQGHVGDKQVPVVGRISMDLTVFDVTDADPTLAREGGMIDLIGPHRSADDWAEGAGTIGYEVLTGLGPRIHRRYLAEAA